ncbi:nf-x1 finger and helicase domain-containing protein [Colletotrichum asianum]|uniref:Nf-x1 finger and helicase domain-containing protein n=1 Tax=Colletotrichum asianum TaxID=702518 RepID=A0A8H3W0W9_9PEZI|nr:nf-x1 finger and helicase domain-containing protein [Colletotrichum asianum]
MATDRGWRSSATFYPSQPCQYYMRNGTCDYGSRCKFSHDRNAQSYHHKDWRSNARNGQGEHQLDSRSTAFGGNRRGGFQHGWRTDSAPTQNGRDEQPENRATTTTIPFSVVSSQPSEAERDKLQAWRRLRPVPSIIGDHDTRYYFRMAHELIEQDASVAQDVIKEMASSRRLPLIKEALELLSTSATLREKASLLKRRIHPLFLIVTHSSIVGSVVVEQEVAQIYRVFLGVNATRLKLLFDFIVHIIDHWAEIPWRDETVSSMETISLSCGVLARVIETSTFNMINEHVVSIVKEIQLRLEVFGAGGDTFHSVQASRSLEYVRRRLDIGRSLPDVSHIPTSTSAMAEFTLSQDFPGNLSRNGKRHDNDHADIKDIKLMPTHEEIMSSREEYLPTTNPYQHHLQGLRGFLDRQFRLLREDTLHDLREAIRTSVETNSKVRGVRTKVVIYEQATPVDVSFEQWSGLEFIVRFDQPRAARALDKTDRAAWWMHNKRLVDSALVCVLDEAGSVLFFQVSRSTNRTTRNHDLHGQQDKDDEEEPYYSLPEDRQHAFVYLRLVETDTDSVKSSLLWFKTGVTGQRRLLFEFPSILLPAFAPPLKALQKMSQNLDLPFQDLLLMHGRDNAVDIPPPLYTRRPGFSFDLGCVCDDGTDISFTPGETLEPGELSRHSSLDFTQSEAILNSLGRSFALIQGPPGTGKSYTGEALIKVLLANKSKAKLGPIICVCYTNHALDQLLEHLIDGKVRNIIRIGSRSKSDRLQSVNLREVVKGITRTAAEMGAFHDTREDLHMETTEVIDELEHYQQINVNRQIKDFLAGNHRDHYEELFGQLQSLDEIDEGYEVVNYNRKNSLSRWLHGGWNINTPDRPLSALYQGRLSEMNHRERVIIYRDWARQALDRDLDLLSALHDIYDKGRQRNDRVRSATDLRCLQQANIIGVTTTGLARNLDLLRRVQSKVLLCEEAGEVLEAHLVTALLPTIEHAILIGDHLQLRPQIQDWRLQRANPAGVKYSLDVSLFERLVHPTTPNTPSLPFSVLDTQRRMHPSISELVHSTYPSLEDSPTVLDYPEVCGVSRRLFWLHHECPEGGRKYDLESIETSYSNDFEVQMVSGLVSHLLKQGVYKTGTIAVLTPYLGQLNKLRQELGSSMQIVVNERDLDDLANINSSDPTTQVVQKMSAAKSSTLNGVRVATVDNFQGEEADVVIVSLVRSNNERRCGFLSTSNRINVLLSRARHGMYIIGNAHTASSVAMWDEVITKLRQKGNFGKELELQCSRHPSNKGMVSHPEHFVRFSPDGGCQLRCDRRLGCGHSCTGPCHADHLHNAIKCLEDCARPKQHCDHPCRKRCGDPCDKACVEVLRGLGLELPCGHTINTIECWKAQNPESIRCSVKVEKTVPGCPSVCGETCPDMRYCQECAADEIKQRVVDLVMMDDYCAVDLDEDPCIFPDCGHFWTCSTMDGQMGLRDFYAVSDEGIPIALKGDSQPFTVTNIKACPDCRGSLRNISRYGRIVRRGILDESTKKFIDWSNRKWKELSEAFLTAQERLQSKDLRRFSFPVSREQGYDLRGPRQEQIDQVFKLTSGARHLEIKLIRRRILHFLDQVRKDEQPYQRVANLVRHVNNRRRQIENFSFDESVIQLGSHLQATTLLLRCDLLIVSDYLSICRKSKGGTAKSVKVDPIPYIKDCFEVIKTASAKVLVRQEIEARIFVGMFSSFIPPPTRFETEEDKGEGEGRLKSLKAKQKIRQIGIKHLEGAQEQIRDNPSVSALQSEYETAWRMLHDGVFYSDVSNDELRSVYKAMSKEFGGTGHWYYCVNIHPFTIGECGMAMETARCPECGEPVGGQSHQFAEGVQRANDIEEVGSNRRRVNLDRTL